MHDLNEEQARCLALPDKAAVDKAVIDTCIELKLRSLAAVHLHHAISRHAGQC
jgi:hypothetical protein